MTSTKTIRKAEEKRAYQEATRQFEALRARWPNAFPTKGHLVRPLASGAVQVLVEELGWSAQYARTVLRVWKLKTAYSQAVLRYPTRMNLDGTPSAETVNDEARQAATRTLAEIAARRIERAEKAAQQAAQEATTEPAPTTTASEPKSEADPAKVCLTSAAQGALKPLSASPAMAEALKRRLAAGAIATEIRKTVPAPTSGRRRGPRSK